MRFSQFLLGGADGFLALPDDLRVAPFLFAAVRRGCLEISVVVDNGELVCGGVDRSQPVIQRRADATEYDRIEYGGLPVGADVFIR